MEKTSAAQNHLRSCDAVLLPVTQVLNQLCTQLHRGSGDYEGRYPDEPRLQGLRVTILSLARTIMTVRQLGHYGFKNKKSQVADMLS